MHMPMPLHVSPYLLAWRDDLSTAPPNRIGIARLPLRVLIRYSLVIHHDTGIRITRQSLRAVHRSLEVWCSAPFGESQ